MPLKRLALLAALLPASLSAQQPTVREVRLRVDSVRVAPRATISPRGAREGASGDGFAAFTSGGELWMVDADLRLRRPPRAPDFPREANYFSTICAAGPRVFVQVSSYPDSVREKDEATPRGGFRAGPTPLGVAVLSRDGMRLIKRFRVVDKWPNVRPSHAGDTVPAQLVPYVQSCQWTGHELVVGAYGYTAALDLDQATARLLTRDGEMAFNRHAVLLVGDTIWTSEDEGGASGGCVRRQVRGQRATSFCVMGYNNAELGVDGLLTTPFGIVSSSAAGLVSIEPRDSSYTHYQLSDDKKRMSVFAARCVQGRFVGLRDDGIAIVDLRARRATLVRIADGGLGAIYAVERVGRHWVLGAESGVVAVRLPLPGWRPWRRASC